MQALIDSEAAGKLSPATLSLVVSSKAGVYALERANNAGLAVAVLERGSFSDEHAYSVALLSLLREHQIDMVVLAGFLSILPDEVVDAYEGRMLNVHPSLIPSFCGEGFFGLRVHKAALTAGVKVTGATVHLVSKVVDGGKILLQQAVAVKEGDTPETLRQRVMQEAECVILPRAVALVASKIEEEAR